MLRLLPLALLGLLPLALYAQQVEQPRRSSTVGSMGPGAADTAVVEVPLVYTYFTSVALDSIYTFSDTTLDRQMHHYDPLQRRSDYYINLGNNGSAHKPLIYRKQVRPLIDFGHHEYDLYRIDFDSLRFYKVNRPIADLAFSSQGGRQNFVVSADFSRSFTDGIQSNIQYRRFIQTGYYTEQAVRNTNLGLSFTYSSPYDKYRIIIAMMNNVASSEQNGGVVDVANLRQSGFGRRTVVPVRLTGATTRYQDRGVTILQRLRLDWRRAGFDLAVENKIDVTSGYFRFQDTDVSRLQDSTFYTYYRTDERGIRYDLSYDRVTTAVDIVGRKAAKNLAVRIGMLYGYTGVQRNPGRQVYHDLLITGKATLPWRGQQLDASTWIGLGSATATFNVSGTLALRPLDGLEVDASADLYRHRPTMLQNDLVATQKRIWTNDFALPVGTTIKGRLRIPRFKIHADIDQTAETNTVYFGTDARPQQYDQVYTATALSLGHGLRVGRFGLDNTVHYQVFSENLFRMPNWTTRHDLWWDGYIFRRAMHTRLGVEATVIPAHDGSAYMPVTGIFYQAADFRVSEYVMVEPYMSLQISKLRAFLKFENFINYFSTRLPVYIENQPQFDARFRLGVRWLLMD